MKYRRPNQFTVSILLVLLSACSQPLTLEQQIISTIRIMEEKIEAGDRRPFMKHIAADFTAQNGTMNREQVRALMIMQLNRYKRLQAQLFPIRVSSTGDDSAKAVFRALVTGGPGWIPESGQIYEFETHWTLTDGEWLLQNTNWNPDPFDQAL